MKIRYPVYILAILCFTAFNGFLAVNGIKGLILNGDAQDNAIWNLGFALLLYGPALGGLSLVCLLFLPLFELKYSRVFGWSLLINGIFPFAAYGIFMAFR
jgi:hypothetical protein